MRRTRQRYPFRTDAIVILPNHLHCIWTLPDESCDFSIRWRLIKRFVTQQAAQKPVWQARFWVHVIRDERDYGQHMDYIHYNPVRHGLCQTPRDWPWSSFYRHVREGNYPVDWGAEAPELPESAGRE